MLYTVIWRAKSGLILLNLSCYIQQEAEEAFCILSLSAFEGLVFQKKLQLASNFFSILFSIQIPRNFLFILWKFLIIETRAVFKKRVNNAKEEIRLWCKFSTCFPLESSWKWDSFCYMPV